MMIRAVKKFKYNSKQIAVNVVPVSAVPRWQQCVCMRKAGAEQILNLSAKFNQSAKGLVTEGWQNYHTKQFCLAPQSGGSPKLQLCKTLLQYKVKTMKIVFKTMILLY